MDSPALSTVPLPNLRLRLGPQIIPAIRTAEVLRVLPQRNVRHVAAWCVVPAGPEAAREALMRVATGLVGGLEEGAHG